MDLVFVLDSSNSVQNFWPLVLNFVQYIVNILDIGPNNVRVGIVRFSNFAQNLFHLNDTTTDQIGLQTYIASIPFIGGNRNVSGALRTVINDQLTFRNGDRSNVENVVIVITGGTSDVDVIRTYSDALDLRSIAKVFSIRVDNIANIAETISISSAPNQLNANYFVSDSYYNLRNVAYPLLAQACTYSGKLNKAFSLY